MYINIQPKLNNGNLGIPVEIGIVTLFSILLVTALFIGFLSSLNGVIILLKLSGIIEMHNMIANNAVVVVPIFNGGILLDVLGVLYVLVLGNGIVLWPICSLKN